MRHFAATLILSLSVFLFTTAQAQDGWKTRKPLWEKALPDKNNVLFMAGGDLNGDYIDDIAVIYQNGSKKGLWALISEKDGYRAVAYAPMDLDFLKTEDLAAAQNLRIETGEIIVLHPSPPQNAFWGVKNPKPMELKFVYRNDGIQAASMVGNVEVQSAKAGLERGIFWYNILTGRIIVNYLQDSETVGGKRGYFFWFYHRSIASKMTSVKIDADDSKWIVKGSPVRLRNLPEANPVSYGFQKWKGDADLSGEIFTGYTDDHFLVHVKVRDDYFNQTASGDKMLFGDHVELWFANDKGERVQIGLNPGNFSTIQPEALLWFNLSRSTLNTKLAEVEIASRKTAEGYSVEAKIPFKLLPPNFKKDAGGSSLFSVVLSDSDEEGGQEKVLSSSSLTWGNAYSLGVVVWSK